MDPTEADVVSFMEKFAGFHATLTPAEQSVLEQMTAAALATGGEVDGFAYTPVASLHKVVFESQLAPDPNPTYARIVSLLR
jgi:hypothetical protein